MHDYIHASALQASGELVSIAAGRLRGFTIRTTATGGLVQFRSGGANGTVICTIHTVSSKGEHDSMLPGAGIRFQGSLHVTMTDVDGLTAFYSIDEE